MDVGLRGWQWKRKVIVCSYESGNGEIYGDERLMGRDICFPGETPFCNKKNMCPRGIHFLEKRKNVSPRDTFFSKPWGTFAFSPKRVSPGGVYFDFLKKCVPLGHMF